MAGGKIWKDIDIRFLVDNYENMSRKELAISLSRTEQSIQNKARELKLNKIRKWSEEELEYIKKNYGYQKTEDIALYLNRAKVSVSSQARVLKLDGRPNPEIGSIYEYYTLLEVFTKEKRTYGKFKCKCGTIKELVLSTVKSGSIKSCGCLNKENTRKMLIERNTKYDKEIVNHKLYSIWGDIKRHHGIQDSWKDYSVFYNWAIEKYAEDLVCHNINGEKGTEHNLVFISRQELIEKTLGKPEQFQKARETCLEKYGVEYPQSLDFVKEKISKNCLEKYGYKHNTQRPEVKEKISNTMLERFGETSSMKNPDVKERANLTMLNKYGVECWSQSPELLKKSLDKRKESGDILSYDNKSVSEWCKEIGISNSSFYERLKKYGIQEATSLKKKESGLEILFSKILNNLKVEYKKQYKIDNLRADFYLPEYKLLIEIDGIFWHSDWKIKSPTHHKRRKELFTHKGYDSLFFRENEILGNISIVKSILQNKIGKSKKIFARKCKIIEVDKKTGKEFLQNNHLMGKGSGKIFGLEYNNELVTCIQVVNKNDYIDISRFCHILNTTVVGGFSKLIKYIDLLYNKNIQTFIDQRYGTGKYLKDLGFNLITNKVSFKWIKSNNVVHRMKFPNNTGYEYGYYKLWDCGQAKYIKEKSPVILG